jgi:hypothetical protein
MSKQAKGGIFMNTAEVTIKFNLDRERDIKIYQWIMNLPEHFGGDLSEAFMLFCDSMILAISKCKERREQCENLLTQIAKRWG